MKNVKVVVKPHILTEKVLLKRLPGTCLCLKFAIYLKSVGIRSFVYFELPASCILMRKVKMTLSLKF